MLVYMHWFFLHDFTLAAVESLSRGNVLVRDPG